MLANITLPAEPHNGPPETRGIRTAHGPAPLGHDLARTGAHGRFLPCCPEVCPRCFAVRSGFLRGER